MVFFEYNEKCVITHGHVIKFFQYLRKLIKTALKERSKYSNNSKDGHKNNLRGILHNLVSDAFNKKEK